MRRHCWLGALFVATALAALWPLFALGLNCDDFMYLTFARGGLSLADIWRHLPGAATRPLSTWGFVGLLHWPADPGPLLGILRFVHHLTNALLVGYIGRRSLGLAGPTAWLAALAFLLWGSHGEVFYFSAIHDVGAATFVLLALALSLEAVPRRHHVLILATASLAAYACKESAWGLPLLLAALPRVHPGTRPWRDASVAGGALVTMLAMRLWHASSLRGDLEPGIYGNVSVGALVRSTAKLVLRSVVPGWVNMQDLATVGKQHLAVAGVVGVVVLALSVLAWFKHGARRSALEALGVCFAIALLPVCQLSVSVETGENARYLYLPTVFVALTVAAVFDPWLRAPQRRQRRLALAGAAVLLLFQGASLHVAGRHWMEASRLTKQYALALESLLDAHPDADHVYVVCAPDNFRGAFAARNVSIEVGRMHRAPQRVEALATRYVSGLAHTALCHWHQGADGIVVQGDPEARELTHPAFYYGAAAAQVGPWSVRPVDLFNQRSRDVLLLPTGATVNSVLAVYDGATFQVVPPGAS